MQIENNSGAPIRSLADWAALAPPASPIHWRPYRSAYELAHAWMEGDAAARVRGLLELAGRLGDVDLVRGNVERKTFFDAIPSGPRNHDLLIIGCTSAGPLVVGVEAKADEPFDRTLIKYREAALRRNPATRAPERLDGLTRAFFGATLAEEPALGALRYQLLSALAGTLADARMSRAARAVLVIHEFDTPLTDSAKHAANAGDLEAFLRRLGPAERRTAEDGTWITGPFTVPGNAHLPAGVPFYVGKLRSVVAAREGEPVVPQAVRTRPDAVEPTRPDASRRRTMRIPVGDGRTVIKLNVHPPGCRCGCVSRGARPFVLNRPGEHVANRQLIDLDDVLRVADEWAADAMGAPRSAPAGSSPIQVGGGATTVTMTVDPDSADGPFVVALAETGERSVAGQLGQALATMRAWAERALAG